MKVPTDLHESVSEFILTTGQTRRNPRGQIDPQSQARFKLALSLLSHLNPSESWPLAVATSVVGELQSDDPRWLVAAELLANSRKARGLNALLAAVSTVVDTNRALTALSYIPPTTRRKKDSEAIASRLSKERLNDANLAGNLVRGLPADLLVDVCAAPPIAKAGDDYLVQLKLSDTEETRLRTLLTSERVPPNVKRAIVKSAASYDIERFHALGPYLFEQDPSTGSMLVQAALDKASKAREDQQAASWRSVAAAVGCSASNETSAIKLGAELNPAEMKSLIAKARGSWNQIGAIVRGLQRDPELVAHELPDLLGAVPSKHQSDFTRGMVGSDAAAPQEALLQAVAQWAVGEPVVQQAMLEMNLESELVVAAGADGRSALDVLLASGEILSDDSWTILSSTASWRDAASKSEYAKYLKLLSARPDLLVAEVESGLHSLGGPEASRIKHPLLAVALQHVLREGLAKELSGIEESSWKRLLKSRESAIVKLGCELFSQRTPTAVEVEVLMEAHSSSTRLTEDFETARRSQASELQASVLDESLPIDRRVAALSLCSRAHSGVARETSFRLLNSDDTEIRLAAAEVLGTEVPTSSEVAVLHEFTGHESDADVLNLLQKAIRRATSGDAAEAIRNLYALVGLDEEDAPDPKSLNVPEKLFGQLKESIDAVRSDRYGTSHAFATSVAVLVDLLAEIPVGLGGLAGLVNGKQKEFEALLSNASEKIDAGHLLVRQEYTTKFDWFGAAKAAHDLRRAHAGKKGSTRPWSTGDQDRVYTEGLLRTVVVGWTESLIEIRRFA